MVFSVVMSVTASTRDRGCRPNSGDSGYESLAEAAGWKEYASYIRKVDGPSGCSIIQLFIDPPGHRLTGSRVVTQFEI